jgi:hypothetical protein
MPGGTCEATVYDVYGFTAGSICVALGNYHNMDRRARAIAPSTSTCRLEQHGEAVRPVRSNGHEFEPGTRR